MTDATEPNRRNDELWLGRRGKDGIDWNVVGPMLRDALTTSRRNWEYLFDGYDHEEQTHDHQPFKYGGTCRKCEAERNVAAITAALDAAKGEVKP